MPTRSNVERTTGKRHDESDVKDQSSDVTDKYSVPVIDRMMEIFAVLEHRSGGASITDLTRELGHPRTTIYRILNTLQRHRMVRRSDTGRYSLGARVMQLAAGVADSGAEALAKRAQPILDRLAATLGEGVKLSVLDAQGVLVLATAQGRRQYALTVTPGQRIPIHVGAAGKVLLAHLSEAERETWIGVPELHRFTEETITDRKKMDAELAQVLVDGWARDLGEHSTSINAVAAPVTDGTGAVVATISVPFLAGQSEARVAEILAAVRDAARSLSSGLAG